MSFRLDMGVSEKRELLQWFASEVIGTNAIAGRTEVCGDVCWLALWSSVLLNHMSDLLNRL